MGNSADICAIMGLAMEPRVATFLTTVLSTTSLVVCIITIPLFYSHMQQARSIMLAEVDHCTTRSRDLWRRMIQLPHEVLSGKRVEKRSAQYGAGGTQFRLSAARNYGRPQRADESPCCACSVGPTGLPGTSGKPGSNGNPGTPGRDAEDGRAGRWIETKQLQNVCQRCPPAIQGPPGHAGKKGMRGYAGPSGQPGTPGSNGVKGPPGPEGHRGPPGWPGAKGPIGHPGKVLNGSPPGPRGPYGPRGPRGPRGKSGPDGKPGLKGMPGVIGTPGDRGTTGVPGHHGPPGPAGPLGPRGTCKHCQKLKNTPGYDPHILQPAATEKPETDPYKPDDRDTIRGYRPSQGSGSSQPSPPSIGYNTNAPPAVTPQSYTGGQRRRKLIVFN